MITNKIRLLVAVAAAACGAALAQPAAEPAPLDPEQQLLRQIGEVQAEGGPTAEGLIEPLRGLAFLYQEAGEHARAAIALQEARQIMRVHGGLFSASVDEALLLRQQIRSEKALGNAERAWNLQQDLLTIARQHRDDLRMLPIFVELIDDRTELLDEYRATQFVELGAGTYVPCLPDAVRAERYGDEVVRRVVATDARACPFGSHRVVVGRLHSEIRAFYAEAIEVIVKNGDYASQELRGLEKQALVLVPFDRFESCSGGTVNQILTLEIVGSCLEPVRVSVGGWPSLMRLLAYEVRSGTPATRANAFAELADWYLRLEHIDPRRKFSPAGDMALALYRQALAELRQGDDATEPAARIFSPEPPVTLPTYAPNPFASTESPRYVDVAFAITSGGKAERIEILTRSEAATRADETDLIRSIKFGSFRPRAVGGELAASAPVVVRYYVPENPASTAVSAR
ncbi:MAG TPA: hypothetical protein VE907_04240 [Gammaproteobacteria bacterium]|nr:hypothetical protein [Gammaproteobacteria bacterium]